MKLSALFRPTGSPRAPLPVLRMPCASSPEEVAHVKAELVWVPESSPYRVYLLAELDAAGPVPTTPEYVRMLERHVAEVNAENSVLRARLSGGAL